MWLFRGVDMAHETAIEELSTILGQRLTCSKSDLELHGRSETHFPLSPPDAVAYPETVEDVARILAASMGFNP